MSGSSDVEIIARHFLGEETRDYQQPKRFSDDAIAALLVHRWPGNVRELKNVVERAAILSERIAGRTRRASDDSAADDARVVPAEDSAGDIRIPREGKLLEDIEREAVALTLKITGGNQAAAARLLGISRPTLAKKMASRDVRRRSSRSANDGRRSTPTCSRRPLRRWSRSAQRAALSGQREMARRRYEAALYMLDRRRRSRGVLADSARARTYMDEGQFDAALDCLHGGARDRRGWPATTAVSPMR